MKIFYCNDCDIYYRNGELVNGNCPDCGNDKSLSKRVEFYACGAIYLVEPYYEGKKEFKLVRPTKGLPYIATEETKDDLFELCKHHSALYKINVEKKTAEKIKNSTINLITPDFSMLDKETMHEVVRAITSGLFMENKRR